MITLIWLFFRFTTH